MADDPRQRPDYIFPDPLYTTPGIDPAFYWWVRYPDAQTAPPPPEPRTPEPPTVLGPLPEPTPIPYPLEQLPAPEHLPRADVPFPGPIRYGQHTIYEKPTRATRALQRAILKDGARRGQPFWMTCEGLGLGGGDAAMEYCDGVLSVEEYDRIRERAGAAPPRALPRALSPLARLTQPQREYKSRPRDELGIPVPRVSRPTTFPLPRRFRPRAELPRTFGGILALRAPRPPRPAPERPGVEPVRPDIFEILRRAREQREREKRRREDLFRRGIPPRPTPDEMAPYPVEPFPRRRDFPSTAPPPLEVPVPRIPAPKPPAQPKIPQQSPPNPAMPGMPMPRTPRRRAQPTRVPRSPPARGAPVRVLTRVAQVAALAILRPILRQRTGDPLRFADQIALPRVAPPAVIENPLEERLQPTPERIPGLTPIQQGALGFAQQPAPTPQGFRRAQREDECVCEETPEEKEEERERNRSNVVATVKPYKRRMSQNSLDNLRKGF